MTTSFFMYSQPPSINCNSRNNTRRPQINIRYWRNNRRRSRYSWFETNDLVESIGATAVQRGLEGSVVFCLHSRFYLRVYIISVKISDIVLWMLPLPEVFVPLSSTPTGPPKSTYRSTLNNIFLLLNKSDLAAHILPPILLYPPFHLFFCISSSQ